MTKAQAVNAFFSSFGIPAYESHAVPDGVSFPYLTYDLVTGDYGAEVLFAGNLWYRSTSLAEINAKTDEIARRIGLGGVALRCDRGHIHLYCGTPWAQTLGEPNTIGMEDDMIKRKYLNFTARYNTMP